MSARLRLAALAWCGLLLASCSDHDDAQETRLVQLESEVEAQRARQTQFEARIASTLDRLADRVDQLVGELRSLGGIESSSTSAAIPADGTFDNGRSPPFEPVPKREPLPDGATLPNPGLPKSPVAFDAPAARTRAAERTAAAAKDAVSRQQFWLYFVVGLGAVVLTWLAWRRRTATALRSVAKPVVAGGEVDADRDCGAWSAAFVLTDAIAPRGANVANSQGGSPATTEGSADADPVHEVFVLDTDDSLAAAVASAAESQLDPGIVVPEEAPREPLRWSFQLEATDPVVARAAIDAYLRHDPRVLQRPAPVVRDHPSGLAVECALLPGLVAGEREHLRATLQRLLAAR
ncbi:MAG: hypothetical protein ABL997_17400 [Planctomycetota bacterium]